jgi:hypothetical protein
MEANKTFRDNCRMVMFTAVLCMESCARYENYVKYPDGGGVSESYFGVFS